MTSKSTPCKLEWVPNTDPDKPDLLGHHVWGDLKFPLWIGETSARGFREALADEARARGQFRKRPPQPPSPPRQAAEARGGEAAATVEHKLLLRLLDAARLAMADHA